MSTPNPEEEEDKLRERLFYTAMVTAWLNTKLERDKQLLGLSVTAIGLLVTLLRTVGASNSQQAWLFLGAIICFLTTVITVLFILSKNASHIEEVLHQNKETDKILDCLDKISAVAFTTGMILVCIIGIYSAVIKLNSQGVTMSQESQKKTEHQTVISTDVRSWNGVSKLRLQAPESTPVSPSASSTSSSSGASESSQSGNQSSERNDS